MQHRVINGRVYSRLNLDTQADSTVDRSVDKQMRELPTSNNERGPRKRTAYMDARVGS